MNKKSDRIEKIVIVGGGTAGWLSAAYLDRALNNSGQKLCDIVLIEASDINPIGVGEATIPTMLNTLRFLGLSESEWMTRCNATFKLAIKFAKWSDGSDRDIYWHSFGKNFFPYGDRLPLYHRVMQQIMLGHPEPFDRSCFESVKVCEAQKSPKFNLASVAY
jgi:tryptophan 6-halogenase